MFPRFQIIIIFIGMNEQIPLSSAIPLRGITIISGYRNNRTEAYVAMYKLINDHNFIVSFPKGHHFSVGQKITMHLDNRTGVEEYDADLRVYRLSYKGTITKTDDIKISIIPDEYQMFYSNMCVCEYVSPGFRYDDIGMEIRSLPISTVEMSDLDWNDKEHENKLGVLITSMPSRPHTSLMAFLSNKNDDVFLITLKGTIKSKILHHNNRCCFAIDHRADYLFEKAFDWNYTIIEADAYEIEQQNPVYGEVKYHFVEKNPWEISFFLSPEIEMFHLKPRRILLPECIK